MSTHSVKIIEIENVAPHPNADRLEIVQIGGWSAVVGKGQFCPGDRAVYVEPDYVVPLSRPEFFFLEKVNWYEGKTTHRVRTARLRNVLSFGLLIPVPNDVAHLETGADVMEQLGIIRYVPAESGPQAMPSEKWPKVYDHHFDVENIQNFEATLVPGEAVIVTEKVDGANGRFLCHDGVTYWGSRREWLDPRFKNDWSRCLTAKLELFLRMHPEMTLYGEVYGVQKLKYGLTSATPGFAPFAALHGDKWLNSMDLFNLLTQFDIPHVPVLYVGPFDRQKIVELAEGDSLIETAPIGHMMEGVVIVPAKERHDPSLGRVALKLISNRYWEN